MTSWWLDVGSLVFSQLPALDAWSILQFVGEKLFEGLLQAVAVVVIGWLVLYRQWRQITQGRSDQVVVSANLLTPIDGAATAPGSPAGDRYVLQLRTVLPPRTIDQILDNVALRRLTRRLAEQASLTDPILATSGTAGFEIVNDIVNSVAGSLASAPFRRDPWLLALTCEDRKVVRKCCIRVLLVRRDDLQRLASWDWCREHVLVESWYHYWRIVTLYQIARRFQEEQERQTQARDQDIKENLLPLVDSQAHHPRVRLLSLGINVDEPILKPPVAVDWERSLPRIAALGLKLPDSAVPAKDA
ncbi:MAG TPA: hypothetical protein VFF52_04980 [Isosphaeraceae bacterium]|nr:hypothetical protein [Isosphaeraceae bacterium]